MALNGTGPTTAATVGEARKSDQLAGSITSENTKSAAANQVLKFHPLADLFPLMSGEEFDALVADIKANGLHEPIKLYEGKILDGRNRYRACMALGGSFGHNTIVRLEDGGDLDPVAFVISKNIHRRHLTAEQKRELIAKLIKAQPEKSDRTIAKEAKVDHKTVGAVRAEQEGRGEIPHVERRTDTKGRKQPAKKKTVARATWQRVHEKVDADRRQKVAAAERAIASEKPRKLTKRQQEEQEAKRRCREKADQVVAILIERLGRDGLVLIHAAMSVTGLGYLSGTFGDAVFARIKGTPDEQLVEDCYEVEDFIAKFGSKERSETREIVSNVILDGISGRENAGDPEASAEAMKAKFAAADDGLNIPEYLRRAPKAAS